FGWLHIRRIDAQMHDAGVRTRSFAAVAEERAADRHFTDEFVAIGERRAKPYLLECRRVNLALNREDFRGGKNGAIEAAGDVGQRGEKKVAERVPGERRISLLKTIA